MFFVIPKIPSETFAMLKKKLPDQFKGNKEKLSIGAKLLRNKEERNRQIEKQTKIMKIRQPSTD